MRRFSIVLAALVTACSGNVDEEPAAVGDTGSDVVGCRNAIPTTSNMSAIWGRPDGRR